MKQKIVFFEVDKKESEYFKDHLEHKAEMVFVEDKLDETTVDQAKGADYVACFVYSKLNEDILDELSGLKGIATMSVGTDHIDLDEANSKHIKVCNVPAYGPQTVAEHAAALMLALSRNIFESVERTKSEDFDYHGLAGMDLMGKTLGIVGTGKIGARLAKIAWGLEMKVIAYDPYPVQDLIDKYGVKYVEMDELLAHSDVISLHIPMCDKNKHFIGKTEFAQMKKGVYIINTARGALIDATALLEALDDGTVGKAGIDVLEDEPILTEERAFYSKYYSAEDYRLMLKGHALMRHPKVIVTPHNAFNSTESMRNILSTTVANLEGMIEGNPLNLVNK